MSRTGSSSGSGISYSAPTSAEALLGESASVPESQQTYLDADDELRGQKYVCLSFLSPEKVIERREAWMFAQFLRHHALMHRIGSTEGFLMGQLQAAAAKLSALEDTLAEAAAAATHLAPGPQSLAEVEAAAEAAASGAATDAAASADAVRAAHAAVRSALDAAVDTVKTTRTALIGDASAGLEAWVKANAKELRATDVTERFDDFLAAHGERLEQEFNTVVGGRTSVRGLKVRGVFDTEDEARRRAKALHKKDPYFHVFVGQVGMWLPWDPNPDAIADSEYADTQLNNLMSKYRENMDTRNEFYAKLKQEKMDAARAAAHRSGQESTAVRPVAGPAGATQPVLPEDVNSMFSREGHADLAIARRAERAASAAAAAAAATDAVAAAAAPAEDTVATLSHV